MENENQIYDMIEKKSFAELTNDEIRKLEASGINEQKYNSIRQSKINLETFFEKDFEQTEFIIDKNLLNALNKKQKFNILKFKIPAYQSVAAVLLAFLIGFAFLKTEKIEYIQTAPQQTTITKTIIDTLTVIKTKVITKYLYDTKVIYSDSYSDNQIDSDSLAEMLLGSDRIDMLNLQKRGKNNEDDSIFKKFKYTAVSDRAINGY